MIGKIFKEVYKTTEKRRSRSSAPAEDALRAEPVEDESGDESD
jgi:hypothetical protein